MVHFWVLENPLRSEILSNFSKNVSKCLACPENILGAPFVPGDGRSPEWYVLNDPKLEGGLKVSLGAPPTLKSGDGACSR